MAKRKNIALETPFLSQGTLDRIAVKLAILASASIIVVCR